MFRLSQSGRSRRVALVENSPLRPLDPRAKLVMSLCASLAVMLPLERLAGFLAFYLLLAAWARLLPGMLRQVWQLKWILLVLFMIDWWLVDLDLALVVTLRLVLLAGVFALLFFTTTASEFGQALEGLGLPYRYAFSLNLAFQSINLLDEEWRAIREAQQARGIRFDFRQWRQLFQQIGELVALTVPAVVLTTHRAWAVTEAASARGFDSPKRRPYTVLKMCTVDWAVVLVSLSAILALLLLWR